LTAAFGALKKAVIWAGNAMPLSARPPAYPSETVVDAELAALGVLAKQTVSDARELAVGRPAGTRSDGDHLLGVLTLSR
jgi:hypothetical protein